MTFSSFIKDGLKKVPATPEGRNPQQTAIDVVNANSGISESPFADVKAVIDGASSARPQLLRPSLDLCDAVIPGNNVPTTNNPALVVALSPNSFDENINQASQPFVQDIPAFVTSSTYQTVLQNNPARRRLMIQNVNKDTTPLFVIFGKATQFNGDVTANYHMQITPGQTYIDDRYVGRVDVVGGAADVKIAVTEFTRSKNVSQ
jgi:hypothetical protein